MTTTKFLSLLNGLTAKTILKEKVKMRFMNNDLLDSEGIKYKNSIQLEQKTKSSVDLLNDLKGGI